MQERKLYGDAKLLKERLSGMQLMEEAAGGWAAVYKDTVSGRFWMKCYTMAGEQAGGGYELLIRLPLPSTEELVELTLHSPHEDEAVAAVMRLLEEEAVEQKDFRQKLVQRLEELDLESIHKEQKLRLRKIITLTSLTDPTNKREVLGKTAAQVQADVAYFEAVSERARRLLRRL
ncbi:hypothetical protein [Pontibacter mangrovi]|uniref:Uncharacterized protein n=1 Tax=Pontibacter mangrovi TaxID=2589816 RepID=A0A501W4B9_9BACT|nr:hypothetical protein [Pontibacter mangrovi]TPE43632.1 hypothetical protein FJM65_12830 [Pontibacter mangrovi]